MRRFRVEVEYEYLADSTQEEQVAIWIRYLYQAGLPLPAMGQVPGSSFAALMKVVEVID